jgi:hypothetical protein
MACWTPEKGSSTRAMERSHFTEAIPYQSGTMSLRGKPCWGGSGRPFIA